MDRWREKERRNEGMTEGGGQGGVYKEFSFMTNGGKCVCVCVFACMCVYAAPIRAISCISLLTSHTSDLLSGYMTVPVMVPS